MTRESRAVSSHSTFIVATGRDSIKPDDETRKFIRSHVMKGKNAGKGKGNSKAKVICVQETPDIFCQASEAGFDSEESPIRLSPLTPIQMGPSSPAAGGLVYEFMAIMKQAMYPIERCVGVGSEEPAWFQSPPTCHDTAYNNIIAYAALAFFDSKRLCASDTQSGQRALMHMTRGIRLLRNRIGMQNFATTDATIFLVLALGMFSEAHGELDAAKKHLRGLYQLVQLRGGIQALASKRFLQIKCCRLDLAVALRTGQQPFFLSLKAAFPSQKTGVLESYQPPSVPGLSLPLNDPGGYFADRRLISIWQDLRAFSTTVNVAHQKHTTIAPEFYQDMLIAAHYQLHGLSRQTQAAALCEMDNALRLAMLTFSTSIFLETRGGRFQTLASDFKHGLQAWHVAQDKTLHISNIPERRLQELNMWMVYVAATTLLRTPEHYKWLREELRKAQQTLQLENWDTVYNTLNNFLWIGAIHDEPAKAFFESTAMA